MALGGIYETGTITIAGDRLSVTGAGTFWKPIVEIGDWLLCNGQIGLVAVIADETHITLESQWQGTLPSAAAYVIVKMSWLRYDPALTQSKLRELLESLEAQGTFLFVEGDEPDPAMGTDGQWALKTDVQPWQLWFKVDGVWVPQPTPAGLLWRGAWSSSASYAVADAVERNGSSYVSKTVNTNKPPESSPADWDLMAAKGTTGATGPTGPQGVVWRGNWSASANYAIGDAVAQSDGTSYIAIAASGPASGGPVSPPNPAKWNVLAQGGTTAIADSQIDPIKLNADDATEQAAFQTRLNVPIGTGTAGYALIGNGASAATYQAFLAAGTGAIARTWQAKGRDSISVKDFGALGDGSTNDRAAIQAAIDAVTASGGGEIRFPRGDYRIGTPGLSINGNYVAIIGVQGATTLTATFSGGTIIAVGDGVANPSYAQIKGFQVNCTTASAAYGIRVRNAYGAKLSDISFGANIAKNIGVDGGNNQYICVLENMATYSGSVGLEVGNSAVVSGLFVHGGEFSNATSAGIDMRWASGVVIDTTECLTCGLGFQINPDAAGKYVSGIFITDCLFDTNSLGGMNITDNGFAVRQVRVVNSWFCSSGSGRAGLTINGTGSNTQESIQFTNCVFMNNGGHGVQILNGCRYIDFHNCHAVANSATTNNTYSGLFVAAGQSHWSVIGGSWGVSNSFGANQQKYGIEIAPGASAYYRVVGADVFGNVTGGISDGGTGGNKAVALNSGHPGGQYPATNTNDNAASGNIGEYISAVRNQGSMLALVIHTAKTVTSITLTPGDWDVWGTVSFYNTGAASVTYFAASINTTTDAEPSVDSGQKQQAEGNASTTILNPSLGAPQFRVSIASNTTYYLIGRAGFTGGTSFSAYGTISARRVR